MARPSKVVGRRYAATMDAIERSRWEVLVASFVSFFEGLGTVEVDDESISFAASDAGTGLSLHRNGTSNSFMPLHEMGGRWERVMFDHDQHEVVIEGNGFSYMYRVPPSLRSH